MHLLQFPQKQFGKLIPRPMCDPRFTQRKSHQESVGRTGSRLMETFHFTFSCLYDAKIDWGWHCWGLGESTLCMTLSDFSMGLYSTPIKCRNCSLISANSSALFATHSEFIMIIILNFFFAYYENFFRFCCSCKIVKDVMEFKDICPSKWAGFCQNKDLSLLLHG